MTFGERVKKLRNELDLSQDILGSQGFVSTPGWIKIENGQRQASEKLIEKLVRWLVEKKHLRAGAAKTLKEELLILKYLGSNAPFLRELAKSHAKAAAGSTGLLAQTPGGHQVKRGRPRRFTASGDDISLAAETPGTYKARGPRRQASKK